MGSSSFLFGGGDSAPIKVIWRRRGTVLAFGVLGLIAAGTYMLLTPKTYTVVSRLLVTQIGAPVSAEQQTPGSPGTSVQKPSDTFHATQARVMSATPVLALAASNPRLDSFKTFEKVRNRSQLLKERIDVSPGKSDEVITLSLRTQFPEEGKQILDSIREAYEAHQKKQRRASADEKIEALQTEKARIDDELVSVEKKIVEFRQKNPEVTPDIDSGGSNNRRIDALQDALTKAELEAIRRKTDYAGALASVAVEDPAKIDAALPPGAVSDGEIERIRNDITETQRKLADQSRTMLPSHPSMKRLAGRLSELNLQLVASMKQQWNQAQQREADVRKSLTEETAVAQAARQQVQGIRDLVRDRDRLTTTSRELDRQLRDVSVGVATGVISTSEIDPPSYSEREYSPSPGTAFPIGGLIGALLGSILALVRESADPRVVSPQGVRAVLGVPVLGTVPPSSAGRSIETFGWSVHADAASPAAEAFRAIRTSLQYALSESHAKKLILTSPEQIDGKSTLISNLAIGLAKSGRNVILVDANLRDPVQHRIFGVSDAVGLVDVLSSGELNERAIRRTTIEHLHVMPAGDTPQNPSELLNTSAFTDCLDQLAVKYDVVLIDSPAAGVVDDARIIAASCDGAILVLRAGKSNRRVAAATRDRLLSVGCRILGAVVNGYRGSSGATYVEGGLARTTGKNASKLLESSSLREEIEDSSIRDSGRSM